MLPNCRRRGRCADFCVSDSGPLPESLELTEGDKWLSTTVGGSEGGEKREAHVCTVNHFATRALFPFQLERLAGDQEAHSLSRFVG